jgi:PTS system mannose-specific IIA component
MTIGILLVTHEPLGAAFMEAAKHVLQKQPEKMEVIDVVADQSPEQVNLEATKAITRLDDGSGVLVMTDITGGTPSNCCQRLSNANNVHIVSGLNLPMLLRALTYRNESLDSLVEKVVAGAKNGILEVDKFSF